MRRAAGYTLAVLTFINLFNYLDRWVIAALFESLRKSELHLNDTELGLIGSGFIIVYTLMSPVFGTLGDRRGRPPLIALGVMIWSIATTLGGFASGFTSLFIARSTVGIGEAAYGTIAPALLADAFPFEKRGRVMGVFFAAIPLGSAAGYILGGLVDQAFGWRAAFWIAGAPGLLLGMLILGVKDPPRGAHDVGAHPAAVHQPWWRAYGDLLHNSQFLLTALGYGAYTFALGGLAIWMPAFLERIRGMSHGEATVTFGAIAFGTGLVGTAAGGWLGDLFLRRSRQSYLWVSGIATLIAAPITFVALTNPDRSIYLPAIVVAEVLIFVCTGPVNSAIINAVEPHERATALGFSVLVMHLLGDVPSPPLIGRLSDATSLDRAIIIVPVAIVVAGVIWCIAAWRGR
ncbi:MAG TPA: MFS transporter [Thermoanaerobaculia bacterium]|nr:MFS transporter [Thermoanaerobaculia bacterium]